MKRGCRFYRKNEKEVMESLGLKPTKNSGSGWVEKEDGQNDFVICQLKSTDAQSISIKQKDLHTLTYNAGIEHKLPLFAIQFLNTNEVWVLAKPEDFSYISEYIETDSIANLSFYDVDLSLPPFPDKKKKKSISCNGGRKQYYDKKMKSFDKTKKAR